MIDVKVNKGKAVTKIQLEAKGTTKLILEELISLNEAVLGQISLPHKVTGEEMPLKDRIRMFCDILEFSAEEEEDDD